MDSATTVCHVTDFPAVYSTCDAKYENFSTHKIELMQELVWETPS